MSKIRGFLLAAGLVLAMAFTLSCSDSGGGPGGNGNKLCGGIEYDPRSQHCDNGVVKDGAETGGVNPSDLPKQVYIVEIEKHGGIEMLVKKGEYKGTANIFALIYIAGSGDQEEGFDTLSSTSKIDGGLLSLNLPKSTAINSSHLDMIFGYDYGEPCENKVVAPANLTYKELYLGTISDGRTCYLYLYYLTKSGEITGDADFIYASKSGKVTGTMTCTEKGESYTNEYNLNYYGDPPHLFSVRCVRD